MQTRTYRFHSTVGSKLLTVSTSVNDLFLDQLTDCRADV